MMKWLFIHKDFPCQYLHVVRHLAAAGDEVVGIGQTPGIQIEGVRHIPYTPRQLASSAHPYAQEFDLAVQNGLAVAEECEKLKAAGFVPDAVIGHNGWGETFFVKTIWPSSPLLGYFEFFYRATGSDADFDPEFKADPDLAMRLRTRNAINHVGFEATDWGQTPTRWQHDQYPQHFQDRISVIHEGVDTDFVRPDPSARLWLKGGISLGAQDQTITYSARSLEPYRGFHVFMRALPNVLRDLPNARVLIVGGDGVSYGMPPRRAASWRQQLLDELAGQLDLHRVHFVGPLNYQQYLTVLKISSVHVYFTYPFVLSWSFLEALSAGCLVIGSRTPPVEEVLTDGRNGYLVDFFDTAKLAGLIIRAVRDGRNDRIRAAARETVVSRFDLKRICLPAYSLLLQGLRGGICDSPGALDKIVTKSANSVPAPVKISRLDN